MSLLTYRVVLMLLIISMTHVSSGQQRAPSAVWLFPAVSWRASDNLRWQGQLGYNHYFRMGLFYPQAFITVHKNIVLNPAYLFLVQKKEGVPAVQEHWLMNAVILQAARKRFAADDRNMLYNRFTVGAPARHYYRNRLRIAQSLKAGTATIRLYAFDEIYYFFNDHNLSRNRAACGISSDLTAHINADIAYIRQWDRYGVNLNLFFITGTWQF